jgi:tight adherence protein B
MSHHALALVVLAASLLLALLGVIDLVAVRNRRELLRERASGVKAPVRGRSFVQRIDERVAATRFGRRLEAKLIGATVKLTPLQFVLAALAIGVASGALLALVLPWLIAVPGGLLVARSCGWWLDRRRDKRRDEFIAQLPELARVLSNATSAGLSVVAALEIAVTELNDPARSELRLTLEEINIGQSFDEAFNHLAERMPSRELGVLVYTLVIQQRSGGDLVRALSDMSNTLDERKETIREVKTIMAGAVTTAYVVAILGVASVLSLDVIQPGSLDRMTHKPLGILILIITATLYATGFLIIRRMTRIDT